VPCPDNIDFILEPRALAPDLNHLSQNIRIEKQKQSKKTRRYGIRSFQFEKFHISVEFFSNFISLDS
jgi:hypothetical protein